MMKLFFVQQDAHSKLRYAFFQMREFEKKKNIYQSIQAFVFEMVFLAYWRHLLLQKAVIVLWHAVMWTNWNQFCVWYKRRSWAPYCFFAKNLQWEPWPIWRSGVASYGTIFHHNTGSTGEELVFKRQKGKMSLENTEMSTHACREVNWLEKIQLCWCRIDVHLSYAGVTKQRNHMDCFILCLNSFSALFIVYPYSGSWQATCWKKLKLERFHPKCNQMIKMMGMMIHCHNSSPFCTGQR